MSEPAGNQTERVVRWSMTPSRREAKVVKRVVKDNAKIVLVAMVTAMVTAGAPAIAHGVQHALFAHNAHKVDGKHAVGSGATVKSRKNKLVATSSSTGRLPNNIIAKAPDANRLDGIDSTDFGRFGGRVYSDTFSEGDPLMLDVAGYGSFYLVCDDNATPGTANDDLVTYGYGPALGAGALSGMRAFFASSPTVAAESRLYNSGASAGDLSTKDDRVQVEHYLRSATGDKVIRISAWGYEDATSTVDCIGMIEAHILR